MENTMFKSLESIRDKYYTNEKKMLDPNILGDIKEYTKLAKETNSLKDIVLCFEQYLNNMQNIEDAKIMLNEKDSEIVSFAKQEIISAENNCTKIIEELKFLLIPKDENDNKNVIMEIRGAAGGDEANIFAGDLFKMYSKYVDNEGMSLKILDISHANNGGFSLIVFSIQGENVYSKLKFESGVHRVQRIPVTETQGRVHTSTTTVTVMPEVDEEINVEINNIDIRVDTYRSSGPGGQSVNTTDSAVRITHIPTNIVVTSQTGKSQISNKASAMKILQSKLYDLEMQKKQQEEGKFRKLAGSGTRSEKIRTYNYPQDRVTDHRIGLSISLKTIMEGKLDSILNSLIAEEQAEKIKEASI